MNLPFTTEQFFEVMRRYNDGVWPAQAALTALGIASVALLWTELRARSALIAAALAFLWGWSGVVYHLTYFYEVNPAAGLFGLCFIGAAALFAWHGVVERRLRFEFVSAGRSLVGLALIAYALVGYPALANALGHRYPEIPSFGLPCPLTIFTIGVLAFLRPPFPRYLLIVPIAWAVIGTQAALLFGVYEDLGLAVAAIAGAGLAFWPALRTRTA